MNTFSLALAAALCAAPSLAQHQRGGGGSRPAGASAMQRSYARPRAPQPLRASPGARSNPSFNRQPPAQHFDLHPAPARVAPGAVYQGGPAAQVHGGFAGRVYARGWGAPDHGAIIASRDFAAHVFAHENDERLVNHVYWHTDGGQRYAHWYDGKVHWYGFYNGPRFYWTRYEDSRWWWFDQTASRWLYWNAGYWWWNDPANAANMYVVVGDNYYPYGEVAADPEIAPGAAPADASAAMGVVDASGKGVHGNFSKASPDGTREVQVYGDRHEAFLYDRTGGGEPRFIAYLATGVKHVQFSEGTGIDLHVMLLMRDGSYDVFDADGRSVLPQTGNGAPATPQTPGTDAIPAQSGTPSDAAPSDAAPPSAPPGAPGATDGSGAGSAPPTSPPPIPAQQ